MRAGRVDKRGRSHSNSIFFSFFFWGGGFSSPPPPSFLPPSASSELSVKPLHPTTAQAWSHTHTHTTTRFLPQRPSRVTPAVSARSPLPKGEVEAAGSRHDLGWVGVVGEDRGRGRGWVGWGGVLTVGASTPCRPTCLYLGACGQVALVT